MRYLMKQKVFALGDHYTIQDESGRDMFRVDGKAFHLRDHLSFQDLAGKELAYIHQRLATWGPTYELYREGELFATVKKHLFTFFRCRFTVDVPGPDDLEATGSLLDHEYTFARGDRSVAEVSKKWWTWADTYGVDIVPDQDDLLILAATVVIDLACHSG